MTNNKYITRLHINHHYVPIEVLYIPTFALSPIVNNDFSAYDLTQEDILAIDKFNSEYIFSSCINNEDKFCNTHAFSKYGILATDCTACYCISRQYQDKLYKEA